MPRKHLIVTLIVLAMTLAALPAFANDAADYASGAGNKLGRGVVNATTGWVEIPKRAVQGGQQAGAAGAVVGFFNGLGMAVTRSVAGGFEIGTFLVPNPNGWGPLMKPTTVFEDR